MQLHSSRFALGSLAVLGLAALSCSGAKNTEIMVAIQTNLGVPKDLNALTVEVFSGGQRIAGDTYVVGPTELRLPATIGIVPDDPSKLSTVDVVVTGRLSDEPDETARKPRIVRRARVTFARDRVGLLRIPLHFACYDQPSCPDGQTCVAGACEPIPQIDGASLPAYSPELVFGAGGSNEQLGACWNATQCLATTTPLVARDRCTFALPTGSDPSRLSVVLAKAGGALGFCGGGTCRVPADRDPREGWDWADASQSAIRLSPGVCDKVHLDGMTVETTNLCASKVAELPLCEDTGIAP